jgi:hypothetical protein
MGTKMERFIIDDPIFFINSKKASVLSLTKGDWICGSDLNPEFLNAAKDERIKAVFIKHENIFSHIMNVLRKIVLGTDNLVIVGIEKIYENLKNGSMIKIDVKNDSITIDNTIYRFRKFNCLKDASEVIEYNLNTSEICYKPNYFYNAELLPIIIEGFNLSYKYLHNPHTARSDDDGRIWNSGFIFPSQFFDYYLNNIDLYYKILLDYVSVLETIFSFKDLNGENEKLTRALILHYSYSNVFLFIMPNISEYMKKYFGESEFELTYNMFVLNSPIHNKFKLTGDALTKIGLFLTNILSGMEANKNFQQVYSLNYAPRNNIALMCFVTNMLSDIRRCVININIGKNKWLESICRHRKIVKIY